MAFKGTIVIDTEGCKIVESVLRMSTEMYCAWKKANKKGYNHLEIIADTCIGCANCAILCPDGVIEVYRAKV